MGHIKLPHNLSRLFAFGCSFTHYKWPTWADILGKGFDVYENWGQSGAGNQFIYNALIECHLKRNLTDDDTVVIMWSSTGREDRYVRRQWITSGNIWNSNLYDREFIENFVDSRGFVLRDLALMYGAKEILENIGCRYVFLTMVPVMQPNDYLPDMLDESLSDVLPYYRSLLDILQPSVFEIVFNNNWDSREFSLPNKQNFWQAWYDKIKAPSWPQLKEKKEFASLPEYIKQECTEIFGFFIPNLDTPHGRADYHPTPLEHLEYLDKVAAQFTITDDVRNWIDHCDYQVRNDTWYEHGTHQIQRW